jgi:hypothetical protein
MVLYDKNDSTSNNRYQYMYSTQWWFWMIKMAQVVLIDMDICILLNDGSEWYG